MAKIFCATRPLQGTQHICPHCNNTIGVPTGFAEPAGVPPQTDTPSAWTGTQRNPRHSADLPSGHRFVDLLPGIVGHVYRMDSGNHLRASGQITNPPGFVAQRKWSGHGRPHHRLFDFGAGSGNRRISIWSFSNAVKQGMANVRQDLATNNNIITRTQSATVSNDNPQMEPVQSVAAASSGQANGTGRHPAGYLTSAKRRFRTIRPVAKCMACISHSRRRLSEAPTSD